MTWTLLLKTEIRMWSTRQLRRLKSCGTSSVNPTSLHQNSTVPCWVWNTIHTDNMIHTHTHTFNGLFSRTTSVSHHQKSKPFWILLKQEMMGWQWHQLDHMQITCTTLKIDNHTSTHHSIFYGPDALPDVQPTVSKQTIQYDVRCL